VFTDGQTDGQKEKSITIYLAVHSVHLADIITGKKISVLYIIIGQQNKPLLVFDDHEDG